MTKHDTSSQAPSPLLMLADIPAAIGLLTRLPVPVQAEKAMARGSGAAWAWPIAGLVPAILAVVVGFLALHVGTPAIWAAGLALVAQVMVTGAMHEDGLADTADGLWGGSTPARRLEIMKDSRIGAYGVIALALGLLLRVTALAAILPAEGAFVAILVTGFVSRAPMVALMSFVPNARKDGLAQSVGRVPRQTALVALAITAAVALVLTPYAILYLAFWSTAAVLALATIAHKKIGGQTGDILGASQQITEIASLAVFAALLT